MNYYEIKIGDIVDFKTEKIPAGHGRVIRIRPDGKITVRGVGYNKVITADQITEVSQWPR